MTEYTIEGRGYVAFLFTMSRLDSNNVSYVITKKPSNKNGSWEFQTGLLTPDVVESLENTNNKSLKFYPKNEC